MERCSVSGCGRHYHLSCLARPPVWPQVGRILLTCLQAALAPLVCPAHTCHTCAGEEVVRRHAGQLSQCLRCPTAFHYDSQEDGWVVGVV